MLRYAILLASLLAPCALTQGGPDHVFFYVRAGVPGPGVGTFTDPFPSVNAALSAAVPHDYVLVLPGLYLEEVNMPPFIYLWSVDGPEGTTIDATGFPGTYAVSVSTLSEFRGFTVLKSDGAGILVQVPGGAKGSPEFGRILKQNRILGCPLGGLLIDGPAHPVLADNLIAGCGFGLRLESDASPWFSGNTLSNNGVGLELVGPLPAGFFAIANSVIWGNATDVTGLLPTDLTSCDVGSGSFAGVNGNISQDPLFVDAAQGDYRLRHGSPCVDAGNDGFVSFQSVFDNRGYGAERRKDGNHDGTVSVDIGAFERGGLQSISSGIGVGGTISMEITTGPHTDWQVAAGVMNTNPTPTIPGAIGYFFLEPSPLFPFAGGTQGASGRTVLTIPITDPAIVGLDVPIQALSLDASGTTPAWTFTNAERFRIR